MKKREVVIAITFFGLAYLARSYYVFLSSEQATVRSFSCMSWPSAGMAEANLTEARRHALRSRVKPDSFFGIKEKFTRDNSAALLTLVWHRDATTAAILRKDISRRHEGAGPLLYMSCGVWSVFQIEQDDAIDFLVKMSVRSDAAGASARRCIERLVMHPIDFRLLRTDADVTASQWHRVLKSSSWDSRLLQEVKSRDTEMHPEWQSGTSDEALAWMWDRYNLEGYSTYRIDALPELTRDELFMMRVSEILSERHPDAGISPRGFPLGFPDRSWNGRKLGEGASISWQRWLRNMSENESVR